VSGAPVGAFSDVDLQERAAQVLDRWPSAGLAGGVVRDGSLKWFLGHGVAEVQSREPITEETVFRIGSITKTFTAVAVMQLWEQGLVDLDAPAHLPADPGQGELPPRDRAPPSDPHGRDRLLAVAFGSASAGRRLG
jgi:CubicO group peptidase (beta-lactamase class C family)